MRKAATLAILLAASPALARETAVPLDRLPGPVMAAVKARFPAATLSKASKEKEDGKLVYEVTLVDQGHAHDVTLMPQGELLLIEKQITAEDLPGAVTRALEQAHPGASYRIVEVITKVDQGAETLAAYEVLLHTSGGKAFEVKLSPEGKVLEQEEKRAGKDQD